MRIIAVVCYLIAGSCFSQKATDFDNRMCFKISPLSFIPAYVGPCAKLSVEYKVKDAIAFQHEVGVFFYSSKGYETKFEVKRYINKNDFVHGTYFSVEFFYKYQSYTTPLFVDTADPYEQNYIVLQPFEVNKNVESLSIKYGQLSVFKFGLITDVFCGIGIRFQQVRNSLSETDNEQLPPTSDYGPNLILDKARNTIYPNFVLGVKIGFRIKKENFFRGEG